MAEPTIQGTAVSTSFIGPASGTAANPITKPSGIIAGEFVIVVARSQINSVTVPPALTGFTYLGPTSLGAPATRTVLVYGKVISDPATEPIWNFTTPTGASRWVLTAVRVKDVNPTNPLVGISLAPDAAVNGVIQAKGYAAETGGLTFFSGSSEFVANALHAPTGLPSGFTSLGGWTTPVSGDTTQSRTYSTLLARSSLATEPNAQISWTSPSSPAAYMFTLRGTDTTTDPDPDPDPGDDVVMPQLFGYLDFTTSNTQLQVNVTPVPDNAWMMIAFTSAGTTGVLTPPGGWQALFPSTWQKTGSRVNGIFLRKKVTGDTVFDFLCSVTSEMSATIIYGTGAAPFSDWDIGIMGVRSVSDVIAGQSQQIGSDVTTVALSVATTIPKSVIVHLSFEATTAAEASTPVVSGAERKHYRNMTNSLIVSTIERLSPGASGLVTTTYPNAQASNGGAVLVVIPSTGEAAPVSPGLSVKLGDGRNATLRFYDKDRILRPVTRVAVLQRGCANVEEMLATQGVTWAHRGGSLVWPEMSEYAADQSAIRGYPVLEFSAQRSNDGWWFGMHDPNFDAVMGLAGTPAASTLSKTNILSNYVNKKNPSEGYPSRPLWGLIEFLDKWTKTHVVVVDPKNALSFNNEFLNILDAHGGPEKIVWKWFGTGDTVAPHAVNARNRGYETWGYFYETDYQNGSLALYQPNFTLLGMDLGASTAAWNQVTSYGKPVVGHIAKTQAEYNTAIAKGANMVQCSGVTSIKPVRPV